MKYRPEDILPDDQNHIVINRKKIRKGTVGAVLANAEIIESSMTTLAEKQIALSVIRELAPALIAINFTKFLKWKNPKIQKIFDIL